MSWHVPTGPEVSAALALIQRFVVPALEALEQGAKDLGAGAASSAKVSRAEHTRVGVIRKARAVIRPLLTKEGKR